MGGGYNQAGSSAEHRYSVAGTEDTRKERGAGTGALLLRRTRTLSP